MLLKPNAHISTRFPNVVVMAILALNVVKKTTLLFYGGGIFWFYQEASMRIEWFVVRPDVVSVEKSQEVLRQAFYIWQTYTCRKGSGGLL